MPVGERQEECRERMSQLRVLIQQHPRQKKIWYAKQLGVSTQTIRRYLKDMMAEETGLGLVIDRDIQRWAGTEPEIAGALKGYVERLLAVQKEEFEKRLAVQGKEYEARLAELEVDKAGLEKRIEEQADAAVQTSDERCRRLLEESGWEVVTTERDEDLTWQGFHCHIPANKPTRVQGVFARMLEDVKAARRERDRIINLYARG